MKILWDYFIVTVLITFIVLYFIYPKPRVILKVPTLQDDISKLYIDDNNICYKYHKQEVPCPN